MFMLPGDISAKKMPTEDVSAPSMDNSPACGGEVSNVTGLEQIIFEISPAGYPAACASVISTIPWIWSPSVISCRRSIDSMTAIWFECILISVPRKSS